MALTTGKATDLITFSRGTLATVTDADGKIKWAPHNLLSASEQFDASAWTKQNGTISANVIAAPNGTTTADAFYETTTNSAHYVDRGAITVVVGETYTRSVYLKHLGRQWIALDMYDGAAKYTYFDILNGVVGTSAAGNTASIESLGNGWFRCTITRTMTTTSLYVGILTAQADGGSVTFVGDVTKGFYAWGAHLYRSDLGGMQANASAYPMYNSSTPRNNLGYSEDFSNAAWTKNGTTITANAAIAPNGSMSADKVVATAAATYHGVRQLFTYGTGTYTISVYAKAVEYTNLYIADLGSGNGYAGYNLATGVVTTSGGGSKFVSAAIEPAANGFFRCSLVVTNVNTTATPTFYGYPTGATLDANGASFTGDGTSGIYLWGAQLSDSASLDAYVPVFGPAPSAAAYHGPRLDYSSSGSALGLLVEEARTNLVTQSNVFNVAAWAKTTSGTGSVPVVTAADAVAPDGTTTAQKVVFDRGAGNAITDQSTLSTTLSSYANATAYTGSLYIKAATAGDVGKQIGWRHVASGSYGVITLTASWQRISKTETSIGTSGSFEISSRGTVTTDNSVGVHLWGVALEIGAGNAATAFATSLISTNGATVTRNADRASVGVSQFPHSSTEGTWVANFQTIVTGTVPITVTLLNYDATGTRLPLYIGAGAQVVGSYDGTTVVSSGVDGTGQVTKAAVAYTTSERAISAQGSSVVTGASTSGFASASTINFGTTGSGLINGWFRQITYLPRRITNAELQSRTA